MGYIFLIWQDFVQALGLDFQSTPVLFRNIEFQRAQVLTKETPVKMVTTFLAGCGRCELKSGSDVLVCGEIGLLLDRGMPRIEEGENIRNLCAKPSLQSPCSLPLAGEDIYKELSLRGLNYSGVFRSLQRADTEGKWTETLWQGNWTAFLDTILQSLCLSSFDRDLRVPVGVQRIEMDPGKFFRHVAELKSDTMGGGAIVRVDVDAAENTVVCPGVEIKFVRTAVIPRKNTLQGNLGFEKYVFCPCNQHESSFSKPDFRSSMWEMMDLVVENMRPKRLITVLDIFHRKDNSVAKLVRDFMKLQPRHEARLVMLTWSSQAVNMEENHTKMGALITKSAETEPLLPDASTIGADLIIVDDATVEELDALANLVTDSNFILLTSSDNAQTIRWADLVPVCEKSTDTGANITLFRKKPNFRTKFTHFAICQGHCNDFEWVPHLQQFLSCNMSNNDLDPADRIYVTSQSAETSGILGFMKCLLEELGQRHLRCLFDPENSLELNFQNPCDMLESIMEKDLVFNVVQGGQLGSYRLVPFLPSSEEKCEAEGHQGNIRSSVAQTNFSGDKTYIVAGGLGGFGLEVANWMIERGARHLILTSRSGVATGYQTWCLRKWETVFGANVQTPILDLADSQAAGTFFQSLCCQGGSPAIGGIFNCAMELQNDEFNLQSEDKFAKAAAPKALLTRNLDILSRKYCPNLDYFVAFSSQVGVRGCGHQTNYGWANSAMDRICERRLAQGQHALSIQWGLVGQVGYASEKLLWRKGENAGALDGFAPQNIRSCLETLDKALQQRGVPVVSSIVVAPKQQDLNGRSEQKGGIFMSKLKGILGISDMSSVDSSRTMSDLGLDSLMAFELQRVCLTEFQLAIRKDTFKTMTLADLKAIENGEYSPK